MTGEMTGSGQCVVFALSRLSQAELIIIREVRLGPGNISQHWLTTPQSLEMEYLQKHLIEIEERRKSFSIFL